MIQVSNQAELRNALLAQEDEIQVIADFDISTMQNINYTLLLHSAPSGTVHTLSKSANFSSSLLRVLNGGSLTLENIILDGSKAGSYLENTANRTLVQVTGGSIHLSSGAVLQNNSSYQEGGGLYLSGDSSYVNSLLMDGDATIKGCNSRTSGGGLTVALRNNGDSVRLAGSAVIEQNTAANGAGVYLRSYLSGVGGALSIGEQVQIHNNTATTNGGGIYCSSFSSGGSTSLALTVGGGVKIYSNQAASGGGIYFYSANPGDRLTLESSVQITGNIVTGNGGGVYLSAPRDSASLYIQDASITDNRAGNGGGVYLRTTNGGTLEITGETSISDNKATELSSSAGGGMWIQNVSGALNAVFSDTSILSNQADTNGGGIFLSNSGNVNLNISGASISQNTANASGGGVYLTESSGAVGTLAMNGVTVINNSAGRAGGGMYLNSGAGTLNTSMDACTIQGNKATANSGGGIWNGGNSNSLSIRSGTSITQNSSESGNGGGIYFNSNAGILTLSGDAKITYNHADSKAISSGGHGGGICVVPGQVTIQDQVEISYNSAGKFGGGLSAAEESVITMSGGSIANNQSGQEGGGIWNHVSSQFTQTGGSITNNTAPIGGGLYNDANSTSHILGGIIQGNTATQYAPGVYNEGTLSTEGLRELSNGLYIENRNAIAYLTGALTAGTTLQLENSNYVTPNLSGTPIVVGEATSQYPILSQTDANGFQKPLTGFDGWEIQLNADKNQVLLAPTVYVLRYENTMGMPNLNPPSYTVVTSTITLLPLTDVGNYHFMGWYDAPVGGNQITEIPFGSTGDRTLYAQWRLPSLHALIYHGNDIDGSVAQNIPASTSATDGQSIRLSNAIPTREGFVFSGWNTEPTGTGTTYQPGDIITNIAADVNLYAQWKPTASLSESFILIYCANDTGVFPACNIPCPERIPAGESTKISCRIPYRACYCFSGWNTRPDGTGEMYCLGQNIGSITKNTCLYAQWEPLPPPNPCLTCLSEWNC